MDCTPQFWGGVLRRLGAEIPRFVLEAWIDPLAPRLVAQDVLELGCPSQLHLMRVRDRFLPAIERCVETEAGRRLGIVLEVARSAAGPRRPAAPAAARAPAAPRKASPAAGPGREGAAVAAPAQHALPFTFETFVVGECNVLGRAAAYAIAHGAQREINPLYLDARTGLGKTHLARAIAYEARPGPRGRIVCLSAETFTSHFTAACRTRRMDDFRRRYRAECDLLVVEDVQILERKQMTQLELFHTVSHLLDVGARVVLTGDGLPRDLSDFDERLRSQISAGLVAQIQPPDAQVRREILRRKAAAGGVRLPADCLELLVEKTRGNVRDLEGVLSQLVATSALLKRPIDRELTEGALHKLAPAEGPRRVDARTVIATVAAFYGVPPDALAVRSRRRDVLIPRQLAMYLCHRYTNLPRAAIAELFGRRHTAVRNALEKIEREILERAPLRYKLEELCRRLEGGDARDRPRLGGPEPD